jgi:dihydrodipicolinate synthase/N-acetylneuraminate lyase
VNGDGYTRRDCLMFLTAAMLPHVRVDSSATAVAAGSAKPMRGAFIILSTPYTASGAVDWDDLAAELVFCDRCGVQGVVWPQGSSGVARLTKDERMRGMDVLAKAVQGKQTALVLGVQGKDTAEMLEYARIAEALAPDAMIAMPPSVATSLDDYRAYFRALGKVTSRPVIVQTTGGAPSLTPPVDLIVDLARELPNFGYVKEESEPLVERMKAEIRHRPQMKTIFGAGFALNWLYEMRLGLDGVMTGMAMYADVMAKLWSLHERHQLEPLRDLYSKFLLMRNLNDHVPGADLYVMHKRGVFKTLVTRTAAGPKTLSFSADEIAEIEYRFEALKPYMNLEL